jgi:hypothetical protein
MLVNEVGPGRIFYRLREFTGVQHAEDGKPVSWNDYTPLYCTKCTSVYVALALLFAPGWIHRLLAASSVSVILDKEI